MILVVASVPFTGTRSLVKYLAALTVTQGVRKLTKVYLYPTPVVGDQKPVRPAFTDGIFYNHFEEKALREIVNTSKSHPVFIPMRDPAL